MRAIRPGIILLLALAADPRSSAGPGAAMMAGVAVAVLAGAASLGGAAWYVRRRST